MSAHQEPLHDTEAPPDSEAEIASRRRFMGDSAKKLAYLAPVVLLFRPNPAVAQSQTGWTHP